MRRAAAEYREPCRVRERAELGCRCRTPGLPAASTESIGEACDSAPASVGEVVGDGLHLDPPVLLAPLPSADVLLLLGLRAVISSVVLEAHLPVGPGEVRFAEVDPPLEQAPIEDGFGEAGTPCSEPQLGLRRGVAADARELQGLAEQGSCASGAGLDRVGQLLRSGLRRMPVLRPRPGVAHEMVSDEDQLILSELEREIRPCPDPVGDTQPVHLHDL